jgi:hypothetical protein
MVMPMPWEHIGDCGVPGGESWMRVQLELAVAYIREVCGEPPKGCEVGLMWQDTDYGPAATIGLCWDRTKVSDAPSDYIANAEVALRAFDDAISWRKLDPELVREQFSLAENEDGEDTEENE